MSFSFVAMALPQSNDNFTAVLCNLLNIPLQNTVALTMLHFIFSD